MKETKVKDWFLNHGSDILSYGGLILCIIIFSVLGDGRLWSAYNVRVLIQSACVYAILSMGALFIYSMGYMDIMVALLLGGMPLSGGMKSKISSSLIGAFTYVILSNGLNLAHVKPEYGYVIKAIVFLAVTLSTYDEATNLSKVQDLISSGCEEIIMTADMGTTSILEECQSAGVYVAGLSYPGIRRKNRYSPLHNRF